MKGWVTEIAMKKGKGKFEVLATNTVTCVVAWIRMQSSKTVIYYTINTLNYSNKQNINEKNYLNIAFLV